MQIFLNSAGGLALFLLAMLMMTEGLKAFAGGALKRLLERWTSTPLRGLFTGILVTGIVALALLPFRFGWSGGWLTSSASMTNNPHFPALRSSHELSQRPSPQKQIPSTH